MTRYHLTHMSDMIAPRGDVAIWFRYTDTEYCRVWNLRDHTLSEWDSAIPAYFVRDVTTLAQRVLNSASVCFSADAKKDDVYRLCCELHARQDTLLFPELVLIQCGTCQGRFRMFAPIPEHLVCPECAENYWQNRTTYVLTRRNFL